MGRLIEPGNPIKNIKTFRDKKISVYATIWKQKKKSE